MSNTSDAEYMDLAMIAAEFQIPPSQLEGVELLYSRYETGNYEGSAFVLYRQGGELFEVNASHCSCYGLEDQWEPSRTNVATIRMRPRALTDWPGLEAVLQQLEAA